MWSLSTQQGPLTQTDFFSSGQVCTNGTRVFVPKSRKTAFEKTLIRKTTQNVRMGNPMDSDVNFGPLVSRLHWEKVRDYISHGKNTDQATLLYDGATAGQSIESFATSSFKDGYWCPPHIFTDCTDDMRICTEEIFGPVMTILTYDDSKSDYLDTLLARANNTTQGLAAGVFSRDLNLAHHVVARLEAGITWINTWGESPAEMSVGGWKLSGVGVENGRKALDHWTQNKSTLVDMSGSIATAFEPLLPGTKAKL
jgi:betaine-aldehyde dehydrogenase